MAKALSVCLDCIRSNFKEVSCYVQEAHHQARKAFNLPAQPPKNSSGTTCQACFNECSMSPGERGYCGIRTNEDGKLAGATPRQGSVSWYYDPLPTNCVADWVCPGGTGAGYPHFAYAKGPEIGYKNLAVFYQACNFNCLFCQNWHFRETVYPGKTTGAPQLAAQVDNKTACVCYFGGDPTPQIPHALAASRLALSNAEGRILRICWETNGSMHPKLLKKMADLSLKTGGCIKFDLKTWSSELSLALCGVSNKRTFENFSLIAELTRERPNPPLLVASTLLVPGYVDVQEVSNIARFIATLNPEIPYSLLGFHPQFYMYDLPTTSKDHAFLCKEAAEREGLQKVKIGNLHLLR
jgi:pyruvate formate lyase activating enzyme